MLESHSRKIPAAGDLTSREDAPQAHHGQDSLSVLPQLMAQMLRYQALIDNISQGVCFFDGDQRLVLSNPRYAEIYHLDPAHLQPGTPLHEIIERRQANGTCPMGSAQDYVAFCTAAAVARRPHVWNAELRDGRVIRVCHQPMEDGGWVATHEDISDKIAKTALANERLSLQHLIDTVPDYLWVKDVDSRFVIANKALAADWGRTPEDMIGLIDSDYHPADLARGFRERELEILRTGVPMIDREENVYDPSGRFKWILSTKMLLRGRDNEVLGFVGIARDITDRKRSEILRNGQAKILEMIATAAPLEDVLSELVLLTEAQLSGISCCSTTTGKPLARASRRTFIQIIHAPSRACGSGQRSDPAARQPIGSKR